jgi:hypothetical protein
MFMNMNTFWRIYGWSAQYKAIQARPSMSSYYSRSSSGILHLCSPLRALQMYCSALRLSDFFFIVYSVQPFKWPLHHSTQYTALLSDHPCNRRFPRGDCIPVGDGLKVLCENFILYGTMPYKWLWWLETGHSRLKGCILWFTLMQDRTLAQNFQRRCVGPCPCPLPLNWHPACQGEPLEWDCLPWVVISRPLG